MVVMNVRTLSAPMTGAQRYAAELARRLADRLQLVEPARPLRGLAGHGWEQWVLPRRARGRLLFSPANTGPARLERQVVAVLDLSPVDLPECMGRAFGAWYRRLWRRLLPRVRKIITISQFTRSRLIDHYRLPGDRIAVTPLAADSRFRPAGGEAIAAARAACGIGDGPYLLCVGTVEPRKNLARLLEAWPAVRAARPDLRLVVAGATGAPQVFGRRDSMPAGPDIVFAGRVGDDHLPGLYSGAELTVYPSLYEGFGLPPLESMACGTPVVVSSAAALVEVAGGVGTVVDPLDVEAIAGGIVEALAADDRPARAQACLRRAAQYSWDRTAEMTWQVLQEADAS